MIINLVTRNYNLRTSVYCLPLILYALFSYNSIDMFRVCHNIASNLVTIYVKIPAYADHSELITSEQDSWLHSCICDFKKELANIMFIY